MATLLYINANPKVQDDSFSMKLGRFVLDEILTKSDIDIKEINLYDEEIPMIDADVLNAWTKMSKDEMLSEDELEKVSKMSIVLEEFINASHYIIVTPMWNFLFPPVLKSYIDCLVMAGKTFKFTSEGVEGLLENKKMLHLQACGGKYKDTPFESLNHSVKYLKDLFGFLGIKDFQTISIENTHDIYKANDELEKAKSEAEGILKNFLV